MPTEQSILERLEALEKQNRWMKRIGVAVIVIMASLLVMAQTTAVNRTVESREFILRDANGTVRSKWFIAEDGPRFSLLDSEGKERVGVYCSNLKDGGVGGIAFPGANQGMGLIGASDKSGPSIIMSYANNLMDLNIALDGPLVEIIDKEGFRARFGSTALITERSGETHQTSAASVILFGKDKKVLWKAPPDK